MHTFASSLVLLALSIGAQVQPSIAIPTQFVASVPTHRQTNVSPDQRVSLIFSRPIQFTPAGRSAVFAQDENQNLIPDQRALSNGGTTLTLTFPGFLPSEQRIRVWINGSLLPDVRGIAVDADGDGSPGGTRIIEFRTRSSAVAVDNPRPAVILGRVFDSNTPPRPLAGAIVRAWHYPRDEHLPPLAVPSGVSNAAGEFVYTTPAFYGQGEFLVEIKKDGTSEALRHVTVLAGGTWRVDDARLMPVTPPVFVSRVAGGTLIDPANPDVRLVIPPNALRQDSNVGVTLLRSSEFIREQLPPLVAEGGSFVDIAGVFGESTLGNVTLEVPNIHNLPVGASVPFGKIDHNTLQWIDLRDRSQTATMGIVKQRGGSTFIEVQFDKFCTICAGYCLPFPAVDGLDESAGGDRGPSQSCDNPNRFPAGSTVMLREGYLEEEIRLPALRELAGEFALTLGYASNAASPEVTLSASANFNSQRPIEATIYKFQVEGRTIEGVYDRTSGNQKPVGTAFWNGRTGQDQQLPTGSYPYSFQVTSLNSLVRVSVASRFGGSSSQSFSAILYPGIVSLRSPWITGRAVIVNQSQSPYGAGWSLLEEHRLHFDADGCIVLTFGNASWRRFTPDPMNAGRWISPPGDYSTLSHDIRSETFRRTFRDGSVHTFGGTGRIQTMADRYGQAVTFTYGNGLLRTVTSPTGHAFTLSYGAGGKLTAIADSAGRATLFSVDGAGDLTQVTDAVGTVRRFQYGGHRLLAQIGARGERSEYGYGNGRVISARALDVGGSFLLRERRFAPSALNGEIGAARRVGQGTPRSPIPVVLGRVDRLIDGRGVTLVRETDLNSQSTLARDGLDRTTRYAYDAQWQRTSRTRPNGSVTEYRYDAVGNLTALRELSDPNTLYSTTAFEYGGPFDGLSRLIDAEGKQTVLGYDSLGNVVSVTDHVGHVTRISYQDPRFPSLPTLMVLPTGDTKRLTYDPHGNVATATDYPDPVANPAGRTWNFAYDAAGNLTAVADPRTFVTQYGYDHLGRVRTVVDALQHTTTYDYTDPNCGCSTPRVTKVTFANNTTLQYQFDGLGRLRSRTDQLGRVSRATWDEEGNLRSSTNRNGETIDYAWDFAGQLIRKRLPDNVVTTYDYDVEGNVTVLADAGCRLTFRYDFLSRVIEATSVTQFLVGGTPVPLRHRLDYTFDRVGNRLTMVDDWGLTSHVWTYDNQHRPATLTLPLQGSQRWTFGYDASGRRTSLVPQPSGARTNYAYDQAGQLDSIHHLTTPSMALDYTAYDGVGNLLQCTLRAGTQAMTSTYSYDTLAQVQSASFSQAFGDVRLSRASTYDGANRLLADNDYAYSYDGEGRMLQRIRNGTSWTESFSYDAEGRLRSARQTYDQQGLPHVVLVAEYTYDPLGRRVEKSVNGIPKRFAYDGLGIVCELDGQNRLDRTYTHGRGIDDPMEVRDAVTGASAVVLTDRLGSVTAIADATAVLGPLLLYDDFGQPTLRPNAPGIGMYSYTAREFDLETGLYYYRARYYDSIAGRFTSEDPAESQGSSDWYSYVNNNPINGVDPLGLYSLAPGVRAPDPGSALDSLLSCIDRTLKIDFTVTGTTTWRNGSPRTGPHGRGEAADIRYSGPGSTEFTVEQFFQAAADCGAGYGQDECKNPSKDSTGPHIHIQIPRGHKSGGRGDLPLPRKPALGAK